MDKIYSFEIFMESSIELSTPYYYSVLGAVLNVFDVQNAPDLLSISPPRRLGAGRYSIKISVRGQGLFFVMMNHILSEKRTISLENIQLQISGISYDFHEFDFDDPPRAGHVDTIYLTCLTPTYTKKTFQDNDINYFLPEPGVFFLSCIRKYFRIQELPFDEGAYREYLQTKIYIGQLDIVSKLVRIKKNLKAGIVGKIKYHLIDEACKDEKYITLIRSLKLANFIGLGAGTKLGLGQVRITFNQPFLGKKPSSYETSHESKTTSTTSKKINPRPKDSSEEAPL